jgi:methyl-accepting chemotaxis protein
VGGEEVGRLVVTMADIATRSNDIVDIVTVIDGIAFQTNILALNASVEAARAGDQGRGFAVVASEVRQLALRSADAARQVRTLVSTSVERIEAGAALASHARQSVDRIVCQIRDVSDTVVRISNANDAQADGINRIHTSIAQMNGITQENAALVEEGAAAAEMLKQQAERLQSSVSVFRIA